MQKFLVILIGLISPLVLFAGPVDINTADAETIAKELDGVGPARARAIVEYRNTYGKFRSAAEITNVNGIGQHVLSVNAGNILAEQGSE